MYSYEERLRAVKLYLKYGRRLQATIRELGYPTKNSLKAWCAEFEEGGYTQKPSPSTNADGQQLMITTLTEVTEVKK